MGCCCASVVDRAVFSLLISPSYSSSNGIGEGIDGGIKIVVVSSSSCWSAETVMESPMPSPPADSGGFSFFVTVAMFVITERV